MFLRCVLYEAVLIHLQKVEQDRSILNFLLKAEKVSFIYTTVEYGTCVGGVWHTGTSLTISKIGESDDDVYRAIAPCCASNKPCCCCTTATFSRL
jgi:hypothetical protein